MRKSICNLNIWLKIVAGLLIISLLGVIIYSPPVQATKGLTIKVIRLNDLLVATAQTTPGSTIEEDSWKWIKSDECHGSLFTSSNLNWSAGSSQAGVGSSVKLNAIDGGTDYCFYVKDSAGRQSVISIQVAKPQIIVQQNNDQLVAMIDHNIATNSNLDSGSWQWFRYQSLADSQFDCTPDNFNLVDEIELREAIERAEILPSPVGLDTNDVYLAQAGVYVSGSGNIVTLTPADTGLNYCFMVADAAGISEWTQITVGEITVDDMAGKKADQLTGEFNQDETVVGGDIATGVGKQGITADRDVDQSGHGVTDPNSDTKTVRNIGIAIIIVALVLGAVMLIKKTHAKDTDEDAQK